MTEEKARALRIIQRLTENAENSSRALLLSITLGYEGHSSELTADVLALAELLKKIC